MSLAVSNCAVANILELYLLSLWYVIISTGFDARNEEVWICEVFEDIRVSVHAKCIGERWRCEKLLLV